MTKGIAPFIVGHSPLCTLVPPSCRVWRDGGCRLKTAVSIKTGTVLYTHLSLPGCASGTLIWVLRVKAERHASWGSTLSLSCTPLVFLFLWFLASVSGRGRHVSASISVQLVSRICCANTPAMWRKVFQFLSLCSSSSSCKEPGGLNKASALWTSKADITVAHPPRHKEHMLQS